MIHPILHDPMQSTLEAIADGASTLQIARTAHVSPNTVKDRLRVLYTQLGAKDRASAVSIGYQLGVLGGHLPALPCVLADGVPLDTLVRAREQLGLTQPQLSGRLGVSPEWLYFRESGRRRFPLLVVRRYAEIVGVDLDESREKLAS
jgi:DNA-binding CsgD family transcriptional regulator/DNA-binding XRE family transcriptional regulator